MRYLQIWDFILGPVYIFIIYAIAKRRAGRKMENEPYYEYFARGILFKMLGGVFFCLIYTVYYNGGDTTAYFESSVNITKLFFRNTGAFWQIIFGGDPIEMFQYFDNYTGYPGYWRDPQSWQVVRWTSLLTFFGFRCYMLTTILLSAATYFGIWRLYKTFVYYFPQISKQLSYSVLLVPSVLFWGSGVLKDTFTLAAAGLLTYSFHRAIILRKKIPINVILLFMCSSLIISIKPYIFLGLVPGALLWMSFNNIKNITNPLLRFLIGPFVFSFILGLALIGYNQIKDQLGKYSSVDKILNKASVTQKDLKQDYNEGNAFDIGEFDPTIGGISSKFPIATFAGLFRPSIIDVKNIVMLLAAIENSFLLFFTLYILFRCGIRGSYSIIANEPIAFFALIFSVFFAFSVGLTTSNFGALVRYKIPAVPFYMSTLFIVHELYKKRKSINTKNEIS
jgi:hypothetical protein